jgi:putative endonuclease
MAYFGYILRSVSNGSYYVGQTKDAERRLLRHNRGDMQATRSGRPWELVLTIEFRDRAQAMHWEQMVKGLSNSDI